VSELLQQVALIDFLPASYREQTAKRRTHVWRGCVIMVFVVSLGTSGLVQYRMYQAARHDLEAVEPTLIAAQNGTRELSEIQSKLTAAQQQAKLLTYLRHPWRRSEILTALAESLPEALTLSTLLIDYETDLAKAKQATPVASESLTTVDSSPPALQDLKRLRETIDAAELVVVITGVTRETAALHQYLAALAANPLFQTVELRSIEAAAGNESDVSQFAAKIVVRQGYGQPKGPAPAGNVVSSPSASSRRGA
jgi:Tfp pilus assembly protein PilN